MAVDISQWYISFVKATSRKGQLKAKVFWSGRSQAIRLPKALRLEEHEVSIHREGARLVIEPLPVDERGWPTDFWSIFGRVDASFDVGKRRQKHERPDPLKGLR